jgi:hypothetical protein
MAFETRVRNPVDEFTLLKPLAQSKRILSMSLSPQTQSLKTEQQLLCSKWVERSTEITLDLDTSADDEGDCAEGLPELEAVVAFAGLDELGEALAVGAPVELAGVDDDAADGCAVAADPFCGGVDDDVSAVVNGADEVAACAEGVVDLI